MPNINKVVYGNTTLIDLTDSTLSSASQLESGVTAYDRSGTKITGTASGGGVDGDNLAYGLTTATVGYAIVGEAIIPVAMVGISTAGTAEI